MSKITSEHLARAAFVYVRQSTAYQVINNTESRRRQYGLVERARQLGWDDVQIVDDDLGRSGGGTGRGLTLDGTHRKSLADEAAQARLDEAVRAHVGRLLLHPHQFVGVLVGRQGVQNIALREGIELVQK